MSNLAEAQRAAHLGEDEPIPEEPRAVALLRTIDRGLMNLESLVVTLVLVVLILVGVYGALKRNFAPPAPFWTDEIIRYAVFWIGLIGAALAAQSDRLFNIDMFTRSLSVRGKLVIRLISAGFTIFVCWLFFRSSVSLREILLDEKGEILDPKWGVLALPIGMALIATHMLLHILIDGIYLVSGRTPPELEPVKPITEAGTAEERAP
jgi:TRAP-type C4-dicarboxylate transport system permease small subunit